MTDIEIARSVQLEKIADVAKKFGIEEENLEFYGKYKAKISKEFIDSVQDRKDGKLILVTAINPTPLGEGKTTVAIGLGDALNKIGRKTVLALREPSLGPVFGIKGGATGGGYAQVAPMEDINLHFTGDIHAITSANNLLSAIIDNHIYESTTDAVSVDHKNIKSGVRRWMIDDYIKSEYKKQTNYAVYNMEDLINKEIADSYIHLPYGKDTILDFLLKDGSEGESHGLICSQFTNLVVQLLPEKKCPTPADLYREVLRLDSMDGDNNVL